MKIIDLILDFIFPPVCVCCNKILNIGEESPFCKECLTILPTLELDEFKLIDAPDITRCYCIYKYQKYETKGIVYHTKNIFSKRFSNFIGNKMKQYLIKTNLLRQIDIITFTPRQKSSIKKFSFDQSHELAKALSAKTSIPYEKLIIRKGRSKEQKNLKSAERSKNVENVFAFSKAMDIKGKKILLLDDVVTTGSTVKACAKILKTNGASNIYVLALAD